MHHTRHPKTPESFLDSFSLEFIDYSQSCTLPVLDIGIMKRPPASFPADSHLATFLSQDALMDLFLGRLWKKAQSV